jgi:hypothetical protein
MKITVQILIRCHTEENLNKEEMARGRSAFGLAAAGVVLMCIVGGAQGLTFNVDPSKVGNLVLVYVRVARF